MGKLFDLEAEGYFYSRLQNPTKDTVARKICELEGGSAAMITSSGHAAGLGSCIVDSGKFDWTKYPDKYPELCTPDESYHGVIYS